ncbi:MAG: hypothetical protein CVT49_00430 [candidate division Zixibacteria bacterium HGW-Zixibacteria-1]|nr:MAG: hypothetical protein CVT49_00430 [candidate division Zixibacteria bacterium HGW-Zixibacteria-1]
MAMRASKIVVFFMRIGRITHSAKDGISDPALPKKIFAGEGTFHFFKNAKTNPIPCNGMKENIVQVNF